MPKAKRAQSAVTADQPKKKRTSAARKKAASKEKAQADLQRRLAPATAGADDPKWIENADAYARHKERARQRQKQLSEAGRDIAADMPTCGDRRLRGRVAKSLKLFCERCLADRFPLEWSPDHLTAIKKMERSILQGESFAIAMPRGSGKTTLVIAAVIWAILCGHKSYVALIGADKDAATKLLDGVKIELEINDVLLDLFPEACHPIRRLEGMPNKCRGQLFNGKRTYIKWTAKHIQFASIPDRKENTGTACRAIIETAGIRGKIRGMQQALPDGTLARPDCFVVDDPQTDTSADSRKQVTTRLNVITGTCPGLAGPGQQISGFVTCTVICQDDVADQILNPHKFPDYQGERFQLVYDWPENSDRWEEYANIYRESIAMGKGLEECNRFVQSHWDELHLGSNVAWKQRLRKDEVSPLQHAYNLLLKQGDSFWAEYQNAPVSDEDDEDLLSVDQIQVRTNGHERRELSPEANLLTAFIDVQGEVLFYVVIATNRSTFTSWVVDYGANPEQTSLYWTKRSVGRKLSRKYPKRGREGRLRAGIMELFDTLANRKFAMQDGTELPISRIGIDAAWGPATRVVQACAIESEHRALVLPTFGRPLEAEDLPMELWKPKPGHENGVGYSIRPRRGGGRYALLDANYWKSFVHSRLSTGIGDAGCLTFFQPKAITTHRMIAEHCRAERREESVKGNRKTWIWRLPASKPDNDYLDCLAGALAMAGICGARLQDLTVSATRRRGASRKRRRRTVVKF